MHVLFAIANLCATPLLASQLSSGICFPLELFRHPCWLRWLLHVRQRPAFRPTETWKISSEPMTGQKVNQWRTGSSRWFESLRVWNERERETRSCLLASHFLAGLSVLFQPGITEHCLQQARYRWGISVSGQTEFSGMVHTWGGGMLAWTGTPRRQPPNTLWGTWPRVPGRRCRKAQKPICW